MITRNPKHNKQSGFTLIETLVAIFILLISITGPMSFAQSGLRASFVARDQVVAFYLAQDAIETIKNVRDNNSLNNADWLAGMAVCVSDGSSDIPCEVQTSSNGSIQNPLFETCSGTCSPMKFDTDDREFMLSSESGATSKFTRTVYIDEIVPNKEAQIIVEVSWDTQFLTERRIVVQENMYNWVPQYTDDTSPTP